MIMTTNNKHHMHSHPIQKKRKKRIFFFVVSLKSVGGMWLRGMVGYINRQTQTHKGLSNYSERIG